MAEIRELRCVSNACEQQCNASENITIGSSAKSGPLRVVDYLSRGTVTDNSLRLENLARERATQFRYRSVAADDAPAPLDPQFTVFVGCTRGVEVA